MASQAKRGDRSRATGLDLTREDKTRRRAYEIYVERGGEPGRDIEDWLQAERELTADKSQAAGA